MKTENKAVKLNIGCGLQCPEDWVNIDKSTGVFLGKYPWLKSSLKKVFRENSPLLPNLDWPDNAKYMDVLSGLKFSDQSVDFIYSSHTFEHFTYKEAAKVLKECYRVLKPGGVIRIIVPDLENVITSYTNEKQRNPENAALKFHKNTLYFEIEPPQSLPDLFKYYFKRKNNHFFLYDESALKVQLEMAGFKQISRMQYGESRIPSISGIDQESRFQGAVCLEGEKPEKR